MNSNFMYPLLVMLSVVLVTATSPACAQTCIADKQNFDFMQTSPTKFHRGSIKDVKSVYKALLKELEILPFTAAHHFDYYDFCTRTGEGPSRLQLQVYYDALDKNDGPE